MNSNFTPALGVECIYKGTVGTITFVCEHYLTVCTKVKTNADMMSDVCLVVYNYEWDKITLMRHDKS